MLVRRWGIFSRKLVCSHHRWSKVALVCAKLHNYCCDRNLPDLPRWSEDVRPDDLPIVLLNDRGAGDNDEDKSRATGDRRRKITEFLQLQGRRRPLHSKNGRC